jgi:hypothetical protein
MDTSANNGAPVRAPAHKKLRRFLGIVIALFTAAAAFSLVYNIENTRSHYLGIARFSARSFFQTIVATRKWNAEHGGVYVALGGDIQPNPYLHVPDRDIVSTSGKRLTLVNPAYMTRLVSDIMNKKFDVGFHITSLRPINPANAADDWETRSLKAFEGGSQETHAMITRSGKAVFRYMAPLIIDESCLRCHAVHGYRKGNVRGGISVFFPYDAFHRAEHGTIRTMVISHAVLYAGIIFIIIYLGYRITMRLRQLDMASETIKKLESFLPICSYCKKIRVDDTRPEDAASWVRFEQYFQQTSSTEFTHSICPDCMKKHVPGGDGKS